MLAILIERKEQNSEEYVVLSSDPDSEDELPLLQVIVNNPPTRNLVDGLAAFIEQRIGQAPELVKPGEGTWFGFACPETTDVEALFRDFRKAIPEDGVYSVRRIKFDQVDNVTLSMSQLLTS